MLLRLNLILKKDLLLYNAHTGYALVELLQLLHSQFVLFCGQASFPSAFALCLVRSLIVFVAFPVVVVQVISVNFWALF